VFGIGETDEQVRQNDRAEVIEVLPITVEKDDVLQLMPRRECAAQIVLHPGTAVRNASQ
jgi:hypothetical protein